MNLTVLINNDAQNHSCDANKQMENEKTHIYPKENWLQMFTVNNTLPSNKVIRVGTVQA